MTKQQPETYRGWPIIFIPPDLYEKAEKEGYDMGYYRKTEPIPRADGEQAGETK